MGGVHTNVTYFTDVKVPTDMIIGEENGGWRLITEQLKPRARRTCRLGHSGMENLPSRTGLGAQYQKRRGRACYRRPERPAQSGGSLLTPRGHAHHERPHVLAARQGRTEPCIPIRHQGLLHRNYAGNLSYSNGRRRPSSLIAAGSDGAVLHGNLEHEYRRATINTFGGGVVEVLRGLVATHGLGMPSHR